jgi:integrase
MTKTAEQKQSEIPVSTSFFGLKVGNSVFEDDKWDLKPLVQGNTMRNCKTFIEYSYIHSPDMKLVAKQYAIFLLGRIKVKSVVEKLMRLRVFIIFCQSISINSFKELEKEILLDYIGYLKTERNISLETGYLNNQVVEELLTVGRTKGWDVPKENIIVFRASETWKERHKDTKNRKTPPIPKDIYNKILQCALHKEKDILTRACIIIQSQTGLRISEVLGIKHGCIHTTSEGMTFMTVRTPKTEKDVTVTHKIFVNDLVVNVVRELEEHTKLLRIRSGLEELFIREWSNEVIVLKTNQFQGNRLKYFIKRHDIRDKNGELFRLKSHQFRVNFVNYLIEKQVPLTFVQKHLNHVTIEMTDYYTRLSTDKITEIVKNIIKPDSKIAGMNANLIKKNLSEKFKGKTEGEVKKIVSNLSKNMYINPLPTGVCLQDNRRGDCDNGDGCIFINCPNYVTTEDFYPVHKRELDLLESEMEHYEETGRIREYQRLKAKWIYLKPIVDKLEEQIHEKRNK